MVGPNDHGDAEDDHGDDEDRECNVVSVMMMSITASYTAELHSHQLSLSLSLLFIACWATVLKLIILNLLVSHD